MADKMDAPKTERDLLMECIANNAQAIGKLTDVIAVLAARKAAAVNKESSAPAAKPVVETAPAAEAVVETAPAAKPVVETAPAAEPVAVPSVDVTFPTQTAEPVCTSTPTTTELEVRETDVEPVCTTMPTTTELEVSEIIEPVCTSMPTITELEVRGTYIDPQHIRNNTLVSSEELKGMCQEVTIVCNLFRPTLPLDASMVPVLPTAPVKLNISIHYDDHIHTCMRTVLFSLPTAPALPTPDCTINALPTSMQYICQTETDTGASHEVVSPEVYHKAYLVATDKPERGPITPMKLADGSHSQKTSFSTHLSLAREDKPSNIRTEMMVLEGPSVVLGHTAIKYFWPKIYNLLAAAGSARKSAHLIHTETDKLLPMERVYIDYCNYSDNVSDTDTDIDSILL